MNHIRGFSAGEGLVPPTRAVDNDAPREFRQELVDVVFHIGSQTNGQLSEDHLFRVCCQSLGVQAAGNPYSGFRHALGRDIGTVSWERVYDLIVRLWPEFERVGYHLVFREAVNRLLSAHGIAWDLDESGYLQRVLPAPAQEAVTVAVRELEQPRFEPARPLLDSAIAAYDARPRRDRDACANSFDALEAIAKIVFQMPTDTLGTILQAARQQGGLNPQVLGVLEALNTNRNRNYGHGVPFGLTAEEVAFTYLANISATLLLARRP